MLEKGLEVDLYTTVDAHGALTWESLNTFYYRGRLGPPEAPSPLAQAPPVGAEIVARWHMAAGESRRFGALTGDYNGIHLADGYARWLGFKRAFFHPQRVIGQCLTHLEAPDETKAQRLDVWLKGPVYHDSEVHLRAGKDDAGTVFALFAGAEQRPSILGRVRNVPADVRLLAVESAKTA